MNMDNSVLHLFLVTAIIGGNVIGSSINNLDPSLITERCLNAPPIENNYTATGTNYVLNNMTVYETANKTIKRVLIAGYDIFAMHNSTKQVIDKLALGYGFKIAMPDYFHGAAWDENNYPPADQQDLIDFVDEVGNWNKSVKADIMALMDHYRTVENVTEFGMFGFCWGAKIATQATTDIPELRAIGLVHPTLVSTEEATAVQAPMYLLPSYEEPNMLPFYMTLQQKFGTNCGHRRFDDMPHGFSSARANFSDPLNRLRVEEVIDILGNFFDRNLPLK